MRYPDARIARLAKVPLERSPQIDLPLKITLTPQGVEWFVRNRRKLSQLRMADSRLEYGITVSGFPVSRQHRISDLSRSNMERAFGNPVRKSVAAWSAACL